MVQGINRKAKTRYGPQVSDSFQFRCAGTVSNVGVGVSEPNHKVDAIPM